MYTERLMLEVQASRVGWTVVRPPMMRGSSGVQHSFSFLASSGSVCYAFEVYDRVTVVDVLKAYIKQMDTGAKVHVIYRLGKLDKDAEKLAAEYRLPLITESEIAGFFEKSLLVKSGGASLSDREIA